MILVDTSVWIDVLRDREGIVLKAFYEVVGVDLLPFLKEEEEVKVASRIAGGGYSGISFRRTLPISRAWTVWRSTNATALSTARGKYSSISA